jgi:hypothetical protein
VLRFVEFHLLRGTQRIGRAEPKGMTDTRESRWKDRRLHSGMERQQNSTQSAPPSECMRFILKSLALLTASAIRVDPPFQPNSLRNARTLRESHDEISHYFRYRKRLKMSCSLN